MAQLAAYAMFCAIFLWGVVPAHAAIADWERGANIRSFSASDFGSDLFKQSLQNLKLAGANAVSLVLPLAQDNQWSSAVYPIAAMPSTTTLGAAIDYAQSLGFAVILKPHVDVAACCVWRAYIDPSDRSAWFASYTALLLNLAEVGQAHGAESIVIGTELITLSADDQYSDNTSHWRDLIAALRSIYSGKLSYGANWGTDWADEKNRIAFWDALDYAGIDAYYPLGSDYYNNNTDSLKSYWADWDTDDIAPFKNKVGKPLIFTEVGYMSTNGAHTRPGESWPPDGVNMTEQANAYEALFSYWENSGILSGMHLWEWRPDPNAGGSDDWDYTPQRKPAQDVLTSWWTGQGPVVRSFTTSASANGSTVGNPVQITAEVSNTGSTASGLIIDIEVYDSGNQKVFQRFYEGESIGSGEQKQYAASWTPSTAGTYSVKLGVFSDGWSSLYAWNNGAAAIVAGSGSADGPVSFSASGSALSSVAVGSPTTLSALVVNSGGPGSALVDIEVYDAGGAKIHQAFFDNQSFDAGQSREYQSLWTPSTAGTYTVKLGVFSVGWASLYVWVNQAATIQAIAGTVPPPEPPPEPPAEPPSEPPPVPPANAATISPASQTVPPGSSIDFSGRNFGREEKVHIYRDGTQVGKAHADGGGSFSTGSMSMPAAMGVYTFVFTGQKSGLAATSTITVQ